MPVMPAMEGTGAETSHPRWPARRRAPKFDNTPDRSATVDTYKSTDKADNTPDRSAAMDTYKSTDKAEGSITCWGGTIRAAVILGLRVDLGICKKEDGFPMPRIAAGLDIFTLGASVSGYTEKIAGSYTKRWGSPTIPISSFNSVVKIKAKPRRNESTILHKHVEGRSRGRGIPYILPAHDYFVTVSRDENLIGLQTGTLAEITVDFGALIFGGLSEVITSISDKVASWFE
jgi:hypothetical protein